MLMNTLIKKLPLLAFVLAAFAAVAFTPPHDPQPEYGLDGSIWRDVTELEIDVNYQCNDSEQVCTRSAPSEQAAPMKPGTFVFLGN